MPRPVDSFARDNLPPREQWPVFLLDRPEFQYPKRFNCAVALVDDQVAAGRGDSPCILAPGVNWSYAELAERVNRIANVLVDRFGLAPGNRVLLRAPNNPMMVATYLAVIKAGGVVVATMPLLRARELATIAAKARIGLAVCDARLTAELDKARATVPELATVVTFGDGGPDSLETLADAASPNFAAFDSADDDVCLIGFTSGTTGVPKGTMHFHRDMLAICDGYARHLLRPRPEDRFIGSPPVAFTFGLGGLVLFPLRAGASTVLLEKAGPPDLLDGIETFRPTICFTAPTAYRAMIPMLAGRDISSLRLCVSAGEALPRPTFEAWREATGLPIVEGIGATEMLHIFIGSTPEDVRPGATGRPVPGYVAKVIDAHGKEVPDGTPGRLAVRGPTGCRYLADDRQATYVQNGWNITGDTYVRDADGYFWYQARSDDMIVSSGYNIAGPEVETALLTHPAVKECGVVGQPDIDRGQAVKAYVVLAPGVTPDAALTRELQEHVKAEISPYKYPRVIEFVTELPRTDTGKLRRAALRDMAAASATPNSSRDSG
ncbi:benzoate-CoA ligase family protein [Alsobacter sp. SYSU M60028]|uniref:Benzoate-CoA ligase family protein n=1 Tax=Alsobacter ponti TaxID=2962936 RepID=A0ABT1L912_9HYPH|nr:benzoate-CoA ligase family protein [Alsobacter ponti]MCP8937977.1 benzoate-CoA ligase family protein [Alsobacter ponti]